MLYCGLFSLNKLDIVEAKEAKDAATRGPEVPAPSLNSFNLPNLNPSFWDNLGFSSKTPQAP